MEDKDLNEIITAYHLSDNNGLVDSNKKFINRSWFWKNLKKNVKFFTIEVYNVNYKIYLSLINVLKSRLEDRESKEFKKNVFVLSFLVIGVAVLGIYLSL